MKFKVFLYGFAFLLSTNVQAIDLGYGFSIKGFGTGGLVNSSNSGADFVANPIFQPIGAGYSNDPSFVVDSKLGIQLDYQATDRLSFTLQALTKQQYNKSIEPVLEWGFAKFKIIPDLYVRAGRIRPALYMLSDYLDVNYANPWIRPPVEFYTSAPLDRMEGVDFLWRPTTGNVSWLVQPYFGYTKLDLPGFYNYSISSLKADNLFGINLSATYSDFTFRAGFGQTDITLNIPPLNDLLLDLQSICNTGLDMTACQQYNQGSITRKKVNFSSVGMIWDNNEYFIMGEFGKRSTSMYTIADSTSWYISGGARIQKLTPYITYSSFHNDGAANYKGDANNIDNFGLGASVNQIVTGLLQSTSQNQQTITLGIRYDFMSLVLTLFFKTTNMKTVILFLCFLSIPFAIQAEIVVVMSVKSGVNNLDKDNVSAIFLGKTSSFPDGSQAEPIDQIEDSAEHEEFHRLVTEKSPTQLKSYWSKMVFSGKGNPPKELSSSTEVLKLIAANPIYIGYI